jgi:hypothetical protein
MKKLSVFLLINFMGITLFAQNSPSDKLFEKMALKDGVTMLSFSKKMLDAVNLNFDDDDDNAERNITGDLDRVKLIIYSAPDENPYMNFRKEAMNYLPKSKYDVVDPKEYDDDGDDKNVEILVLRNGRKIKECHIIIGDNDDDDGSGLLISFFGNFKVEDLQELASKAENYR